MLRLTYASAAPTLPGMSSSFLTERQKRILDFILDFRQPIAELLHLVIFQWLR